MKAILVKNDDFQTVGFEVTEGKEKIYSWGVAPIQSMYYVKEISYDANYLTIFSLIRLDARLCALDKFVNTFFSVCDENPKLRAVAKNGVKMSNLDGQIKEVKDMIQKQIERLK